MFTIGTLSKRTGVKVPTIRYYEGCGVLEEPGRSAGGQRRYDQAALERLTFVRHARDLGFSLEAIKALIALQEHPDQSCAEASEIASEQLAEVREKLARLQRLEQELGRISAACDGDGPAGRCQILRALGDHSACASAH